MRNRLSKNSATAGVASRRAAEELIFSGRVKVKRKKIFEPQFHADSATDEIRVDDETVTVPDQKVYFVLNKPHGYICSHTRIGTKKLVYDLFADRKERLFTVGRLDRDTTGLLLLTNDGHFAHEVIHPSKRITKEYLVKVAQEVENEHLVAISNGCSIEGSWIKPHKVVKVRRGTIKVSVGEGKKREVRLLVANADLEVLELKRVRIGGLHLGNLPEGAYKQVSKEELNSLFA